MPAQSENLILIETLERLLACERGDAFSFLIEAEPYVGRSASAMWRQIESILAAGRRRQAQLADLLEKLAASAASATPSSENQYLSFLSMEYLLPKLIEAKRQSIQRYESAIQQLAGCDPAALAMLSAHLEEHQRELQALEGALK